MPETKIGTSFLEDNYSTHIQRSTDIDDSHIYGVAHLPNWSPYGDARLASAPFDVRNSIAPAQG